MDYCKHLVFEAFIHSFMHSFTYCPSHCQAILGSYICLIQEVTWVAYQMLASILHFSLLSHNQSHSTQRQGRIFTIFLKSVELEGES